MLAVLYECLNAAQNVQTQACRMHIHGCSAPHANCDLHTVMNSFDLWIHIFDLPHRCRVLAWHADFIFIVSVVSYLHLLNVLITKNGRNALSPFNWRLKIHLQNIIFTIQSTKNIFIISFTALKTLILSSINKLRIVGSI